VRYDCSQYHSSPTHVHMTVIPNVEIALRTVIVSKRSLYAFTTAIVSS
jgi:hypothetical protein